jgi:hypothetical protein
MSSLGIIKISKPDRLETVKDIILEHRAKAGNRASYELYGIDYGSGRVRLTLVGHAPTSGDFSPLIAKKRLAALTDRHNMVAEFRGAWKSDTEGKVVAYESEHQAAINANK